MILSTHEENTMPEDLLPQKPPVNQLMVESFTGIKGLIGSSDTVFIDTAIVTHWKKMCGNRAIGEVTVEALNGKLLRCKLKPAKKSYKGKGIIQMPDKIQHALHIKKGELVITQPVIS